MSSGKGLYDQLPATIDPIQLAERGARLVGSMPLRGMARLVATLLDGVGDALVELAFERGDNPGMAIVHGTVSASVKLTCQRCLEPMMLDLRAEPRLVFFRGGEDSEALIGNDEALEADRPMPLSEMVEDELLLAVPMIPMHELNVCPAREYVAAGQGKPNPFATLKGRKPNED
jgi:uncharacterized protein